MNGEANEQDQVHEEAAAADAPVEEAADTAAEAGVEATDLSASEPASLRTRFKAAVAPVEAQLDALENAQHQEGQAVALEDQAREALATATAAREVKTQSTTDAKTSCESALAGLTDFVAKLQAELSA